MSENWLNLNEKVYIVTGGSSGIGEAIVKELLNDGAYVYDADLQPAKEEHDHLTFVETDVTNKEQVDALVARVVEEHGHIDGVVNNAGINLPRLLVDAKESNSKYELTENDFDKMFNVNVKSVFLMSQGQSIYSGTKAAIVGLTRSWAKELGEFNVRVVGVAPGIMEATGLRTLAYEEALAYTRHKTVEDVRAGYKSKSTTPLGRSGKLSEVADLVAYYLSDRSSYITGVTTNVAGGKSRG